MDNEEKSNWKKGGRHTRITAENLIMASIFYTVRKIIPANWLNDRDQFLYPNDGWQKDKEFQNDCLAYTIFNTNVQSGFGINHWIPFTEQEVNAKEKFASNFMTDFIQGRIKTKETHHLFSNPNHLKEGEEREAKIFSPEAKSVFEAGRELWKYYHSFNAILSNASLYDIREFFQGRNDKGRMNAKSSDETYTMLIGELRSKLNLLAQKITPKVYEYGFLKE